MSDTTHRRKPLSLAMLMVLLFSFVLPFASSSTSALAQPTASEAQALPAAWSAAPDLAPSSVTLVGDLQQELGCSADWQPECAATHLANMQNGVWRGEFTVPAGSWNYKNALDDNWNVSYPANDKQLTVATAQAVRFFYDDKSHAVIDSINNRVATVAGSFQSELNCPGDWQPECVRTLMNDADGDGIYTFTTTDLPAGSYEFKVTQDESWTPPSFPGNNVPFTMAGLGQRVTFGWNTADNAVTVDVEAVESSHDNNVEYDGLEHDSRSDRYRTPFGAVTPNTPVTLRLRTYHNDVTTVRARFYDIASGAQFFQTMGLAAADTDCHGDVPAIKTCDFWTTTVTPTLRSVLYYRFIVADGTATAYYEDDARVDGGLGEAVANTQDRSYNIYVYDADFATPDWAKNATIYQIFVERFRNGDASNDPSANPASDRGWFYPTERGHRFPITPWNTVVPDPEPYSDDSREYWATYSSTMYGGDLIGVTQKISDNYFGSLGVTTLYLNPIFDSPSNHKYDGRDYRTVDPAFGGKPAFDTLISVAHGHGLKVILDGVPNHVSSDSPFFDRFARHSEVGACESLSSPYRNWFFFEAANPAGTGVCAGDTNYRGWFGVATLPQINTANPEVLSYWFGTPGGQPGLPTNTAGYWIEQGADGWRIDVVPDIVAVNPHFFETWRTSIKTANPNAVLYSETWPEGDVRDRVLGDEFDSTMNYRYRKAVLGLLRDTRWTDNDGGQEIDALSPTGFVNAFETMREDYPKPAFDAAMNLIDSHDTNRAVHVLNELGFTGSGYDRQPVDGFADARNRLAQVAVLQMTLPGAPTIYYGDEVGLTGYGFDIPRDDPYNRQPYPWADQPGYGSLPSWRQAQTDLLSQYQAVGKLRRDYSYFRTGSFDVLRADDATDILAYGRKDSNGAGIVVFNRGDTAQNVTLDLTRYIAGGTILSRTMPLTQAGSLPPTSGATYTFSVAPRSYGIWLTPPGTDLTPPAAPANLTATPGNGVVGLTWSAVGGASSYNVYRSLLTGGGYELIANPSSTTYNDTTVANGRRYFYVVKALDGAGNESAPSNEASATPAFPIDYAVLQSPKTIVHTIGITPTPMIYGQVFVSGITNVSGSPDLILAQVGYGPLSSDPNAWTTWQPMTFNVAVGNNYEYQGNLRPDQLGDYDMLVRFSTNGGLTWAYGDKDGFYAGESGTDDPGDLTVVANADTTPPAVPQNLRIPNWSDDFIALQWDAVADAALYRVYRSTITGTFDFSAPLAEIAAPTTAYTDTGVTSGIRYHYVVKALDHALNASPASNEVSQVAEPQLVEVTFNVTVPAGTPGTVYVAGNNADAFGQTWNPGAKPLTQTGPNTWSFTVSLLDGTALEYKYTRGAWEKVEKEADGNTEVANRTLTIDYGTNGVQTVANVVQNWRDPLVSSHSPAAGATNVPTNATISATWNQEMPPTADFSVFGPVNGVSGTFGYVAATRTTVFTPTAPLEAGTTYTVTVNGETDVNNDQQQVATAWSFTTEPPAAVYAVDLHAPAPAQSGAPGSAVVYTLAITNTGNTADTYALSDAGAQWGVSHPASVGPIAAGASATFTVTVSIPNNATGSDIATITATSQSSASATDTALLVTTAAQQAIYAVDLQAPTTTLTGAVGSQVQYTLTITNAGNTADTYALSDAGAQWGVSHPATVGPIAAGASATFSVMVAIPTGTTGSDSVTITATSQSSASATDTVQLVTHAATKPFYLPLMMR